MSNPISNRQPAIILVSPQMGENIGATARVMANFGLKDLRIINPRDGWPNDKADTMSAGAFEWGVEAKVFDTLEAGLADLTYVLATTARPRGMEKPVFNAEEGIGALMSRPDVGVGVMFGAEKAGLLNEDVALADGILTYPVDRSFSSLNLAQAVGVFAHSWAARTLEGEAKKEFAGVGDSADREQLVRMFEHFEDELDRAGFFFPAEKRPVMTQNLRNAFIRAQWTNQEVQTFRGAVKALALGRGKARIDRKD
ncbi:RNA methyltransferase [Hirschia baltica]|uniref:tRNA/rRNA methyltransferase (SpoU) n=1 Tax=Hirschia baltica (strain ATCC 49814 / DSM 5838 / IFAM 1418) TaxID=582402 RepID=C6XNM7_HIRBI|nr:RNA methyltransferase [Hirschia baltica]ACT58280.1 tRNA/rRNA methyltransferase (SpoU) [Hirschia baltica ATCC 49814]